MLHERTVRREQAEFLGVEIRAPACLRRSGIATGLIGNRRRDAIASALARNVCGFVNARLLRRSLGRQRHFDRRCRAFARHVHRHARVFDRLKLRIPRAHFDAHRLPIRLRLGAHLDETRHIGDEPTHHLTPRTAEILLPRLVAETGLPHVPDQQRRRSPAAKTLRDQCGMLRLSVVHRRHDHRRGFRRAGLIQDLRLRKFRQPFSLLLLIGPQTRPRLQPAFARERQLQIPGRPMRPAIEIDRQHVPDGGARKIPVSKRLRSTEHQKAAAPLADK